MRKVIMVDIERPLLQGPVPESDKQKGMFVEESFWQTVIAKGKEAVNSIKGSHGKSSSYRGSEGSSDSKPDLLQRFLEHIGDMDSKLYDTEVRIKQLREFLVENKWVGPQESEPEPSAYQEEPGNPQEEAEERQPEGPPPENKEEARLGRAIRVFRRA